MVFTRTYYSPVVIFLLKLSFSPYKSAASFWGAKKMLTIHHMLSLPCFMPQSPCRVVMWSFMHTIKKMPVLITKISERIGISEIFLKLQGGGG